MMSSLSFILHAPCVFNFYCSTCIAVILCCWRVSRSTSCHRSAGTAWLEMVVDLHRYSSGYIHIVLPRKYHINFIQSIGSDRLLFHRFLFLQCVEWGVGCGLGVGLGLVGVWFGGWGGLGCILGVCVENWVHMNYILSVSSFFLIYV